MADEEELEELKELKSEEEGSELEKGEELEEEASELTQKSSSKILIGLLSLVVFLALFMFFRGGGGDEDGEIKGPTINVPSPEEDFSPPIMFPKDEAFQGAIVEEPSAGEILIQSDERDAGSDVVSIDSEDLESMDSESERIDPIPEKEISIFKTLKKRAPKDLRQQPPSELEKTVLAREPDISPGSRFAIQVGAFKKESGAKTLAQRLERNGYDSFVSNGDGNLFRVQIGSFKSREAAKKIAAQIRKSERLDSFIVRR